MDDMYRQHETPTGDAGARLGHYLTAALAAADTSVRLLTWLRRPSPSQEPVLRGGDLERAGDLLDPRREGYDAMLGGDAGRKADDRTALLAWVSAQPHRAQDAQAELVASRAEVRLRELHPDAMRRYDELRAGLSPVEAMREVAPLIVVEQTRRSAREVYLPMLDRSTARTVDSTKALAAWTAALPLAETLPEAAEAAAAAEARLRELHPRTLGRYDELRTSHAPDLALAEITPLIDPAVISTSSGGVPQFEEALTAEGSAEDRYASVVREVLSAQVADEVLRDDAWPALAGALKQAERLGAHPTDLLVQVAGEREIESAKSVAGVLLFRVQQREPTAADIASSSYPTPLTAAQAPAQGTTADPFVDAWAEQTHRRARLTRDDTAAVGAAVELGQLADGERHADQVPAAVQGDTSTPPTSDTTDVVGPDHSGVNAVSAHAEERRAWSDGGATAPAAAGQSYPTPVAKVSAVPSAPAPAVTTPGARTAGQAAPSRAKRR